VAVYQYRFVCLLPSTYPWQQYQGTIDAHSSLTGLFWLVWIHTHCLCGDIVSHSRFTVAIPGNCATIYGPTAVGF
jgi:hypothetical protein